MRVLTILTISTLLINLGIIHDSYAGKEERKSRREKRQKNRKKRKENRASLRSFWKENKDVCLGKKRDSSKVLDNKENLQFCCYKLRQRLVAKGVGVGAGVAAATFLTGGAATAASWGGSMKIAAVAAAKGSSAGAVGAATGAAGVGAGTQSKRILKDGKRWDELACKDVYVDIKKNRKKRRKRSRM